MPVYNVDRVDREFSVDPPAPLSELEVHTTLGSYHPGPKWLRQVGRVRRLVDATPFLDFKVRPNRPVCFFPDPSGNLDGMRVILMCSLHRTHMACPGLAFLQRVENMFSTGGRVTGDHRGMSPSSRDGHLHGPVFHISVYKL